jgi:prolycopene isomerase
MKAAMRCRFCEHPACCSNDATDIPGILRRVAVGNFLGAKKRFAAHPADADTLTRYESSCIRLREGSDAVELSRIICALMEEHE